MKVFFQFLIWLLVASAFSREKGVLSLSARGLKKVETMNEEIVKESKVSDKEVGEKESDFVVFDYGPTSKKENKNVLSETVKEVIRREFAEEGLSFKASKGKQDFRQTKGSRLLEAFDENELNNLLFEKKAKSEFILEVALIDFFEKESYASSFEVNILSDPSFPLESDAKGKVHFDFNQRSALNDVGIKVMGRDFVPVNTVITGEKDQTISLAIPTFTLEAMRKFFFKNEINVLGGILLSSVNASLIGDVEIDLPYYKKFYLNKERKIVSKIEEAFYVMFIGVQEGNTMVSYFGRDDLRNVNLLNKMVHIVEDELTYDNASMLYSDDDIFTLHEENILGKKKSELFVDDSEIRYFSGQQEVKKNSGLNRYEILGAKHSFSSVRHYLSFHHLNFTTHLGMYPGTKSVIHPSLDYIEQIMYSLNITDLRQQCLIQVNVPKGKELLQAHVYGVSGTKNLPYELTYLDKTGSFSTSPLKKTIKLFLQGYSNGVFDLSLEYLNGEKDIFRSYCAKELYLIEEI